jgi:hypothetical protein
MGKRTLLVALAVLAGQKTSFCQEAVYILQSRFPAFEFELSLMDPQSGAITSSVLVPSLPWSFLGMAHDGSRLLAVWPRNGILDDALVSLHPANGAMSVIGHSTGFNMNATSTAVDPTSGTIYVLATNLLMHRLFTVHPTTGVATLVAPLPLFAQGMAINHQGVAYLAAGTALFRLDLATGAVTPLGQASGFPFSGVIIDLAFDGTDRLLACHFKSNSETGIYEIDLNTLSGTLLAPGPYGSFSIAVGPVCESITYCTPKVNSLGCLPSIDSNGQASLSASTGFTVSSARVRNNKPGLLLLGMNGRAAIPFQAGTLCVAQPLTRGPVVLSGGSAQPTVDCSGVWSLDFNAFLHARPSDKVTPLPKDLPAGTVFNCQWWGRDTPSSIALSEGLEFTLCP